MKNSNFIGTKDVDILLLTKHLIMKNIVFLLLFILASCSNYSEKHLHRSNFLGEIVLMRTEGLILLDKVLERNNTIEFNEVGKKILMYYANSQNQLVELCENNKLNMAYTSYEDINQNIEDLFKDSLAFNKDCIEKLLLNFQIQKSLYLQILQNQELEDLHAYSLDSYLEILCFIDDVNYLENSLD